MRNVIRAYSFIVLKCNLEMTWSIILRRRMDTVLGERWSRKVTPEMSINAGSHWERLISRKWPIVIIECLQSGSLSAIGSFSNVQLRTSSYTYPCSNRGNWKGNKWIRTSQEKYTLFSVNLCSGWYLSSNNTQTVTCFSICSYFYKKYLIYNL